MYRFSRLWPRMLVLIAGIIGVCAITVPAGRRDEAKGQTLQRTHLSCQLQSAGESTVTAIAGPQTLHLADGRFVRLAEIMVPSAEGQSFDPSVKAVAYLKTAALGRKVEVKFGGAQRDRYGVYIAHVFVAAEAPLWLQEALIREGYAEALPQPDNNACARRLMAVEADARDYKRGLWGIAYFKVLQATDPRLLLNLVQTYQMVEGKVDHVSESGSRLTLHFSPEGRYGFAAVVEPAAKRRLMGAESSEKWRGLLLRVRGWLDRKRGPAISVTTPEQIEFLQAEGTKPPVREKN